MATPISDIYALKSIRLINTHLPEAIKNWTNIDAREHVALANTLSGIVESTSSCTSEHSLEHDISAYHHQLPHGADLIKLSLAYFGHFANKFLEKLSKMAIAMGADSATPEGSLEKLTELQRACDVDTLKMSDYKITAEELPPIAKNARETMGRLFTVDPVAMSDIETLDILKKSFRLKKQPFCSK